MKFTLTKKSGKEQPPKRFSWNPIHPRKDWERMLIVFIVLAFALAGWSAYLYFLSGREHANVPAPVTTEDATAKRIDAIESFFRER